MSKRKKTPKTKQKSRLFLLCVRDQCGIVLDVLPGHNYDDLMMVGMDLAKEKKGTWELYNSFGRLIDGSTK